MANVDIRIRQVEPLATPRQVVSLLPVDEKTAESIRRSRQTVNDMTPMQRSNMHRNSRSLQAKLRMRCL
jgi:3-deoxy-D-arabino-heptulosonate 7-phosphate (DAHP) synthase